MRFLFKWCRFGSANHRWLGTLLQRLQRLKNGQSGWIYSQHWRRFRSHCRPRWLIALSAAFSFRENGIRDEEIANVISNSKSSSDIHWEVVRNEPNSQVRRKINSDTGVYEYRCTGTYSDISARDFVDAQMDLGYRQKWDPNVQKLEIMCKDDSMNSEVIQWIAKFPYPMYPREYVYVRRKLVDEERQCIVIMSVSSPQSNALLPTVSDYVRVHTYRSIMIVRAHKCFDEKGFDYVLSYYDNPESNLPKYAYNWIINSGGPYFLKQVHDAAQELERIRKLKAETESQAVQALEVLVSTDEMTDDDIVDTAIIENDDYLETTETVFVEQKPSLLRDDFFVFILESI